MCQVEVLYLVHLIESKKLRKIKHASLFHLIQIKENLKCSTWFIPKPSNNTAAIIPFDSNQGNRFNSILLPIAISLMQFD